jgi:DNA-binding NarL/FixJ family response regulator
MLPERKRGLRQGRREPRLAGRLQRATAVSESIDEDEVMRTRRLYQQLTPKQREVAKHLSRSLQNKEIAALLGSSVSTVRKHTIEIFRKLRVQGRVQAAVLLRLAAR